MAGAKLEALSLHSCRAFQAGVHRTGCSVKAVVYAGSGAAPVLTQVAEPDCPADGVVIGVGATGVCRSDWHAWKGHDPVTLPHIGGHEFAGVVVAAGPGQAESEQRRGQLIGPGDEARATG